MLNNRERIREEKDCAKMLGITLKEYHHKLNDIKAPKKEKGNKFDFDNTILNKMGLDEKMLKRNKYRCD